MERGVPLHQEVLPNLFARGRFPVSSASSSCLYPLNYGKYTCPTELQCSYFREMQEITVSRLLGMAWERFKVSPIPFIVLLLLAVIVIFIPLIGHFVGFLLFSLAFTQLSLAAVRQEKVTLKQAFSSIGKLLKVGVFLVLLELLPMLLIFFGYGSFHALFGEEDIEPTSEALLLGGLGLIVLGVILRVLFQLFFWAGPYFILDGKNGVWDAFGASFSLFSQYFVKVAGLMLASAVVTLLGAVAFGVGLFVAIPVVHIAWAALYVGLMEGGLPEAGEAPTQA